MFGINNETQLPDFTRLPDVSAGSEVTVLLTAAKETRGTKGHYAIFEGKISDVHKGDMVKGETVRVMMTRLDDSRRILRDKNGGETNYGQIEVMEFLKTVNGGPFPKANLAEAVKTFCDNIEGVAVKIIARPETVDGKTFTKRTFVTVNNQDLATQKKLLGSL